MKLEKAAALLKELGHSTRLKIYRRLVTAGTSGLSVGTLQKELDIPGSTLSHHISALVAVCLVKQRRDGRTLYCTAQYSTLEHLLNFLTNQCCADTKDNQAQDTELNYWKLTSKA